MKLLVLAAALIWPGAVEGPYGTDLGCDAYLTDGEEGATQDWSGPPGYNYEGGQLVILPDGVLYTVETMCTFALDAAGNADASCAGEGREWTYRFTLKRGLRGALVYEADGERASLFSCMIPAQ